MAEVEDIITPSQVATHISAIEIMSTRLLCVCVNEGEQVTKQTLAFIAAVALKTLAYMEKKDG